ncbi:hypothetical protein [Mycobacterium sherrisii]|uniref:hypothetical protein n=1 Tax=Mycobacterium sherrisii TaxID=243061 RepID=UPI001E348EB4|nr:hypothetical protein [Mycobacterium sherrisii]
MLAAADGASNAAISRTLGVCEDTVRKWALIEFGLQRVEFAHQRMAGNSGLHCAVVNQ